MASLTEWKVPSSAQPRPEDYRFDLDRALSTVVGLHSIVPPDALTADTLGTERAGNGVVIDDGLVLTIGYVVTEAETVWLHLADGRVVQADTVGVDRESGFGLVQALGDLDLEPLPLGSSAAAKVNDPVVVAGVGGRSRSLAGQSSAKEEFAGYWEYLIDEAIFTRPAHPNWGGTGLISAAGELIGIGSLQLERENARRNEHLNMNVPIDLLKPVLDDLRKFGQVNKPARPWLGILHRRDRRQGGRRRHRAERTGRPRRTARWRRDPCGEGRKGVGRGPALSQIVGAGSRGRRCAAYAPSRGRHLRRGDDIHRPCPDAEEAKTSLSKATLSKTSLTEAPLITAPWTS